MTIAAAYLMSEGVVLGADSTTTVMTPDGQVAQVFDCAQKVFEIGNGGRMGACTWGAAQLGNTAHRTVFARLADSLGDETVQAAAEKLAAIAMEEANRSGGLKAEVGYFLGGWNLGTRLPACCRVHLHTDRPPDIHELQVGEARFFGCPGFFTRVFHGFDPALPQCLLNALLEELRPDFADAVPQHVLVDRFSKAFDKARQGLVTRGHQDLPIREAIDFIHAYLHVTIKAYKFRYGPSPCGGPIEIGFVTTDRPFRWATHKPFETAIVQQYPHST